MLDEIYEYIPNLHVNHTLCYFMNDCRIILKQKNPSGGSDVRSSKKRRTAKPFFMPQDLAEIQVEQPQKEDNYQEYTELENLDGFRFEADIYV